MTHLNRPTRDLSDVDDLDLGPPPGPEEWTAEREDDVPAWAEPAWRQTLARESVADRLTTARCPRCGGTLVALQGLRGPRFRCGCLRAA